MDDNAARIAKQITAGNLGALTKAVSALRDSVPWEDKAFRLSSLSGKVLTMLYAIEKLRESLEKTP